MSNTIKIGEALFDLDGSGIARSVQTQIGLMQDLACKLLRTETTG